VPNEQGRGLTVLTEEEPVPEAALEVLERGVAHEVAVLTVLQRAVGPAGAVEGVVVQGDNVHDGGVGSQTRVPREYIPGRATKKHPQTCKQKKSRDWITRTMSRDPTYPDIPEGSERGHRPSRSRGSR
jgi:hypothetical protein